MAATQYANVAEKKLAYLARFTPGECPSDFEMPFIIYISALPSSKTYLNPRLS